MKVYLLYFWKKIRDSKIRTKLTWYLVFVAIICSLVIGGTSYITMKNSLIDTVEDSAISLMKQTGVQMEERIREFQDTSYSFASGAEIKGILDEDTDTEKSTWKYSVNQKAFVEEFLQYTILHQYSDHVIMETDSGEIYYYDPAVIGKEMTHVEAGSIMEDLRSQADADSRMQWLKRGDQVYFLRTLFERYSGNTASVRCRVAFAVSESFFELEEDMSPYVSNQNLVLAGQDGEIFKNNSLNVTEKMLNPYITYKDGSYYIYVAKRKIETDRYLVIPMRTPRYAWNILCFIPYSIVLEKANQIIPRTLLTTVGLLAVGLLVGFVLYRTLRKNLEIIEQGMLQYEEGNYSSLLSPAVYDEIGYLILQFNHMGLKINELNELTRKEEEEKQLLEYQVMEAQINPHFLYNTLGSLKWLAYEKEQDEIAKLADAIINLLRFTVKKANQYITLKEELDYVRQYIYIQQTRYENTFRVEYQVNGEAEQFILLGFILQPFLENSILHGLDNAREDGLIVISGEIKDRKLVLAVTDNGLGMTEEKLQCLKNKIEENKAEKYKGFNGIGVTNIILRLKMVYGSEFQYQIESEPGMGTSVTLVIPERKTDDEETSIDCRG
ncbi:sensor histidine kinase [Ruminococcus sp. 5_1_39BFAA]|uniref:sensor histidine kinase n=1 Tax=Ruminococcus sp. 5_1_39BFAA TaxID=457412 RepID=UPI003567C2B9